MELIGNHHPAIRRLRTLRRDRSLRDRERVFLAEGIHLAREALDCDAGIELVVASPKLEASDEGRKLLRTIRARRIELVCTSAKTLDSVQDARSPQPVTMLVERPEWPADAGLRGDPTPLVVVAHGVQDPGNLGTMMRTADAAGATAFRCCEGSVDLFHPRVVRAGAGAVFRLPARLEPIDALLARLRELEIAVLAADPHGGIDYDRSDMARPVAIVFGNEGGGLPDDVSALAERVRIPIRPGAESLSVGAAAAVLLLEAARQRRR